MDSRLVKRLQSIEAQIDVLYKAEEFYLSLDAAKDHQLATLTAKSDAPSQVAKDMSAKATKEWLTFRQGLATSEAEFHKQKHLLDLKMKAYDGEHLSLKVESPVIGRQI